MTRFNHHYTPPPWSGYCRRGILAFVLVVSGALVELCAGTAAVSLAALACRPIAPLTGYMGGKRRWARQLVEALGFAGCAPDRVTIVDAGPWGDVWSVLRDRDRRRTTAHMLRTWGSTMADPHALWQRMVALPPPAGDDEWRVAQYLWLQARSAGTIPIWWSPERSRWESPTGARTELAHERGGTDATLRTKPNSRKEGPAYEAGMLSHRRSEGSRRIGRANQKSLVGYEGARGMLYPSTIADRIDALDTIDWSRVDVVHADVKTVEPDGTATVFIDPPYMNCPRYAAILIRTDLLAVVLRHANAGARVAISEGVDLRSELDGTWYAGRLSAKAARREGKVITREEWVTANFPISFREQLNLWSA